MPSERRICDAIASMAYQVKHMNILWIPARGGRN